MLGSQVTLDSLRNSERCQRNLADRLYDLDQALRRTHPETITPIYWAWVRRGQLELLAEQRASAIAMADFLRILREAMEDDNSRRHNPPQA